MFTLLVHLLFWPFQISTTVWTTRAWTMPLASIKSMVTHATAQSVSQEHFVKRVRFLFGTRYDCMETSRWCFEFCYETFLTLNLEMFPALFNRKHNYSFQWNKKNDWQKSTHVCRAHALTIKKIVIFSDINYCTNTTCQNNGTCFDQIVGFICSCMPGFTGTYCETSEIDFRCTVIGIMCSLNSFLYRYFNWKIIMVDKGYVIFQI